MCSCRAACACRHYFFGQRRPDGLGLLSACALNIYFCICSAVCAACLLADTFDNIVGQLVFLVVIVVVFGFLFACSLCVYMYYVYYSVCAVCADTFDNIVGQMVFLVRALCPTHGHQPPSHGHSCTHLVLTNSFNTLSCVGFSSFLRLNFARSIPAMETWCPLMST